MQISCFFTFSFNILLLHFKNKLYKCVRTKIMKLQICINIWEIYMYMSAWYTCITVKVIIILKLSESSWPWSGYAYSASTNHALFQNLSFHVSLAHILILCCASINVFEKDLNVLQQLKRFYSILLLINLTDIHFSWQDRCLQVAKQSGRWKTNVVYQASFNPGIKRLINRCLKAVYISSTFGSEMSSVLQWLSDSLICCFVWVRFHAL